jgi:predicted TIM-barrel fold metal-dependent hydrolase
MTLNESVKYDHAIARDFDSVSQIDAMNTEGVDIAVLYPSRGLGVLQHEELDPPFALAISRAYNDWLYEFCQHDPQRLKGAAMIPLHDIDDAVLECRRAVEELGMVAFFPGHCPHKELQWHEPFFDPLWAEVQRLGVTWGIHEGINRDLNVGSRFGPYVMSHIVNRPIENMLSCTSIIVGGVLERFPELKVALLEGNCSWAPFLLDRMDEHVERLAKGGDPYSTALKLTPSEYFKRQCTVTMESDESTVRHVIDAIGDDCITFTTDFPHSDAYYPHATETILGLPGLTDTNKRKILWDNSARIYGL